MRRTNRRARVRAAALLAASASGALLAPAARAASDLVLIPEFATLIPLLVGFVVLSLIVNPLIVQPVLRVLDERRGRIEGARRRAEKLQADANDVLARYESEVREVREEAERARREHLVAAHSEQAQITADARTEAESEIESSRRELAGLLDEARASLRRSSQELAREAAERILGRALS